MANTVPTAGEAAFRRQNMVAHQVARRGVSDRHVLDAMAKVPREAFIARDLEEFAYDDSPLPIAEGQTISQPYIVAAMAEAANLKPGDKVLEVGAGSGYAAAVFAELAAQVFTIERRAALAEAAKSTLARLGYDNVEVRTGDGTRGLPEAAPFDAIIVAASGPRIPDSLKRQLKTGGRLILPVSSGRQQSLRKIVRTGKNTFDESDLGAVRFVPLIGEEGWNGPQRS
jgi:protein-L-isoaspartate(D-aspartate) O-methyltransferase